MNEEQALELRKLIVYTVANVEPETHIEKNYNAEILYSIPYEDLWEISDLILADYTPELSYLRNKIENKEL